MRQLVEAHGGTVTARSEGQGRGSTFTVRLPAIAAAPADTVARARDDGPAAARDARPAPLDGITVLVVDDDIESRDMAAAHLEEHHARVLTAATAVEALELLKTRQVDVLLADVAMPDEDGYSLIRKVRALDQTRGSHTVAVAVTAYARTEDRVRALQHGYDWHVSKPVEPTS